MWWTNGALPAPEISQLPLDEVARFDPERLEDLCRTIGEVRAEAEVALALHRISEQLPNLMRLLESDEAQFVTTVDDLARDAELIGMSSLARVAGDVLRCFTTRNEVALAATLARLERVGERSIHAVWDLEDLSV